MNLQAELKTVYILISWPADLDLHCLQNKIYRGFSIVGTNEFEIGK